MEQLETLKSQEKTITRNAQVVEQMYALLAQYDVKAPSEDMVQVDDLRTIKVNAQHALGGCKEFISAFHNDATLLGLYSCGATQRKPNCSENVFQLLLGCSSCQAVSRL